MNLILLLLSFNYLIRLILLRYYFFHLFISFFLICKTIYNDTYLKRESIKELKMNFAKNLETQNTITYIKRKLIMLLLVVGSRGVGQKNEKKNWISIFSCLIILLVSLYFFFFLISYSSKYRWGVSGLCLTQFNSITFL